MQRTPEALRRYMERRRSAMELERHSFIDHYKALSDFISPKRGRFLRENRNRGERRWSNIVNSKATQALDISTSGLFNGIVSPTRPWLWLGTDDEDRNEFGPHKEWLWTFQERLRRVLLRSNFYSMAPSFFKEFLLYGTSCQSQVDDPAHLSRFYTHTVGSYSIAQNERGVVDTVVREYDMTVEQIIREFSPDPREINPNVSIMVRSQYDRGNYDAWYPVVQFADPNPLAGMSVRQDPEYRGRPFRSSYYEPGNLDTNAFLEQKGFREFPFYVPRWEVTGEDIYGTSCPGIVALGDVRALQLQERRKAQGIDKMVSPPLHGPPTLRGRAVKSIPNGYTIYDQPGQHGLRPVYEVNPRVQELMMDIERVENRINDAFHVDLFQAISSMQGIQPRNELELMQRHQERLLQLGPMLERFHGEYLDMVVDRTANQMLRANMVPDAPDGLEGREIKAKYVSTLAMAQQSTTTGNIDRMVGFISALAQSGHPDFVRSADKLDADQTVDEYAGLIGAPPRIIRSDEAVAEKRQAEDQQMQQAKQMEQMSTMADAAGKLGGIPNDSLGGEVVKSARKQAGVTTDE